MKDGRFVLEISDIDEDSISYFYSYDINDLYDELTDELIAELNIQQHDGKYHPYTCGGNRTDANHLDGEGILIATKDGWICPYCDYKQDIII
jgi:hypothetical protein